MIWLYYGMSYTIVYNVGVLGIKYKVCYDTLAPWFKQYILWFDCFGVLIHGLNLDNMHAMVSGHDCSDRELKVVVGGL